MKKVFKTVPSYTFFHQPTRVFLTLNSFFETIGGFNKILFFRENLETLFTEIWWYSWVKIWPSITNKWFHRKHAHVLFYFCRRYSVKLGPKKDGIHVTLWDKNLLWGGIHWNTGFFGGVEGLRPPLHQKKPGFYETTTQVSSPYSKVSRETIIFWSEFHWNRLKKNERFPLKTFF